MKKLRCLFWAGILCGCVLAKRSDSYSLTLIHTNDLHSHLLPFDESHDCSLTSDCLGGFARLKTFMIQEKDSHTLILDAGDRFTETSFYTLLKSKPLLPLFQQMPYDVITLGNHEFDDNLSETISFLQQWPVSVVAANLKMPKDNPLSLLVKPSVIVEKAGRKIGIIGVITQETMVLDHPKISVTSISEAVSKEIESLKGKGVNIIIVLSHIGLDADQQLAQDFPDIDVIVGGHSHSFLNNDSRISANGPYPIAMNQGKTLIVTSGMGGQFIGQLQLVFDSKGDILEYQGNTIPMDSKIPNDPQAIRSIQQSQEEILAILSEPIITLPHGIGFSVDRNYCDKDCPIGQYLTKILHTAYPSIDGVLLNSGSIRRGFPAGQICYQHLIDVYPFDNSAVFIHLTGKELKGFLEHGIAQYRSDKKTNALLQTSGITYHFSASDKKIKDIFVNGKPVELAKNYTFLISSYLVEGGDGYPKKTYQKTGYTIREILKKQMKTFN